MKKVREQQERGKENFEDFYFEIFVIFLSL